MRPSSTIIDDDYYLNTRTDALLAVCDTVPMLMGIAELSEDGEEIHHLHGNAAVARYFGVSTTDLENKPASKIGVSLGLLNLWVAKLRGALRDGEMITFEYEHSESASGTTGKRRYWSKATAWPLSVRGSNGGPRFVYLIEDISPYRVAEAALRESRRFLAQVASTTPHIWYVHDLQENRNVYSNREIATVLGYTADEVEAMESSVLSTVIHPDDVEMVTEHFTKLQVQTGSEVTVIEFRALRKDGSYCWLSSHEVPFERDNETGLVRQVLGVAQDITQQHEAAERLAESESHLRLAIEGADIGTFVVNFRTGIVHFSPHARHHLGLALAQESLTIAELDKLVFQDDRAILQKGIEAAIAEKSLLTAECRIYQADGSLRWGSIKAQLLHDPVTNTLEKMTGVLFDIHDRKCAEMESNATAERQSRIAQALQRSILSVAPPGGTFHSNRHDGFTTLHTADTYGGWQVAMLYEPAFDEAQVGGDFYDMFSIDDRRTAFVVGDVAGKGLHAAESVAEMKFGLRSVLRGISADPAFALSFLNDRQIEAQALDGRSRELLFAVTIVVADNDTGILRIARAGSEPPLICRTGTDGVLLRPMSDLADFPLGTMPETQYYTIVETLAPDETLLLYTDGLTDSMGAEPLDHAISYVLAQNPDLAADCDALCRQVLHTIHAPTGYRVRRDDTCLLAARRR